MKSIKFRVWDKEFRQMGKIKQINFWQPSCEVSGFEVQDWKEEYSCDFFYNSDNFVFMQYTGLKDKNGVEIYEGDIVTSGEGYGGMPPYDHSKPRVVEFRNGCWCYNAERYCDGDWIRFGFWTALNEGKNQLKQVDVIGNIHENPELMK